MESSPARKLTPLTSVVRYSECKLPTEYGVFRVIAYREEGNPNEHLAIVQGDVSGKAEVLTRAHSECLTGEVLHSLKCDCREQLDLGLRRIAEEGVGVVLYLRQEGRGIGLGDKIRVYEMQQKGYDTVDANRVLGFEDDRRRYHMAADILADLGIRSIALMTNNPKKVEGLRADGVNVARRVPHLIEPHALNRAYLETKAERMGHVVDFKRAAPSPEPLRIKYDPAQLLDAE